MKLPFRIVLCKESPHNLINVLDPFRSFCNDKVFVNLNLPILLVRARQREKSQKLNQSLLFSALCAMNFQK